MKRIFIFFLLLTILTACVPTPEEEVVKPKQTGMMIEIALSDLPEEPLEEIVGVPESKHVEKEFTIERSGVTVTVDADVVLPQTNEIPLVHIRQGGFSQEFRRRVMHVLGNDSKPIDVFPKSYYQDIANRLMARRDSGDLDKYNSVEEINRAILDVLKEADEAPAEPVYSDRDPAVEMDFHFVESGSEPQETDFWTSSYCGISQIGTIFHVMMSTQSVEYYRNIQEITHFENAYNFQNPLRIAQPMIDRGRFRVTTPERSMEDARAEAQSVMDGLQLSPDFTLTHARIAPLIEYVAEAEKAGRCDAAYEFLFTRQVSGVNVTYTNDLYSYASSDADPEHGVAPQWRYERVRVYVDDQGVLAFYYDGAPYEILECSSDAVRVLPLEEAVAVFEKRLGIVYAGSFDRITIENPSIRITEIRLGLTRVLEQNAPRQAYLVPSWTFFGVEHLTDYNNMPGFEGFGYDGTTAILTVNAIDGSIIDRNAGY